MSRGGVGSVYIQVNEVGAEMMYILFANIEYKNGDFERKVITEFIDLKEVEASALVNNATYEEFAYMLEDVKNMRFEVRVADDLGDTMSHFESGVDAIILGSYQDLYFGSMEHHHKEYSIYIRGKGSVSWYKEDQLELVRKGCGDVLVQWRGHSCTQG